MILNKIGNDKVGGEMVATDNKRVGRFKPEAERDDRFAFDFIAKLMTIEQNVGHKW